MSLHINLYHEIQKQALARRRDPLKIAMIGLIVIGVGFAAFYFYQIGCAHSANVRAASLQADWMKIDPRAKTAKAREDELSTSIKVSETLVKQVESRFYWAPIFGQVLQVVPHEVQITRLSGDASSDPAKAAHIINISGIASSATDAPPRKVAEDLRTALDEKLSEKFKHVTSSFRSLEDSDENVTLDGKRCPTASFAMEFQITSADAEPTPAPVRKSKSAPIAQAAP